MKTETMHIETVGGQLTMCGRQVSGIATISQARYDQGGAGTGFRPCAACKRRLA